MVWPLWKHLPKLHKTLRRFSSRPLEQYTIKIQDGIFNVSNESNGIKVGYVVPNSSVLGLARPLKAVAAAAKVVARLTFPFAAPCRRSTRRSPPAAGVPPSLERHRFSAAEPPTSRLGENLPRSGGAGIEISSVANSRGVWRSTSADVIDANIAFGSRCVLSPFRREPFLGVGIYRARCCSLSSSIFASEIIFILYLSFKL